MLVGVGGSGKQSLARLAAFICSYDVFQIAVSSTYGVADFKEALLALYTKAGAKGQPVVFLMTDNQIVKEQFLVFINDLLSTGVVQDLFTAEVCGAATGPRAQRSPACLHLPRLGCMPLKSGFAVLRTCPVILHGLLLLQFPVAMRRGAYVVPH
jgi:hypothetical protein